MQPILGGISMDFPLIIAFLWVGNDSKFLSTSMGLEDEHGGFVIKWPIFKGLLIVSFREG